ncbi:hypothetical protein GCM10010401_18130 [Rarobacter faecitabidus]|uniref:L-cystine uptake protein TcyP n=1 Tax=Rarobacter faecitabidus TaxID=13243 RepID=A0A542ZUI3_RARFA|nr:dicarboxylate/amino acid:cation symporter [Rarobacter faecitabidus]TQL64023.1 hypothetical protein FB461_0508 [Rarobacter faecitabidus]
MPSWDVIALVVTAGIGCGLFVLTRRKVNFSVVTLLALFLGVGLGIVFRGHVDYVQPIGRIYVNLLLAIVAPLVIVSILSSITSLGSTSELKAIGGRSVFWLLALNFVSILLTLGISLQVGLGKGAGLDTAGVDTRSLEELKQPFTEVFVNFFPTNIVKDISENNIIPIILFSILIAIAYSLIADRNPTSVAPFKRLIDASREIIYKAVGFIIALTPYAVLALTTSFTSTVTGNSAQILSLLKLLVIAFVVCFISAYLINAIFLRVSANVSPIAFFKKILPAQLTAFTTQSSAGTLPLTTSLLRERVGVPPQIAGFTAPLGTTIGMPGCAGIWPILLAVFAINGLNISYGLSDYAVLVLLGLLVSIGTAGVPGTATITATTVLTAAGLPLEVVILTLPISAVADMARTMNNVTAAAVAATIVARKQGELDDEIFAGIKQAAPLVADTKRDEELVLEELEFDTPDYGGVPIGACAMPERTPTTVR